MAEGARGQRVEEFIEQDEREKGTSSDWMIFAIIDLYPGKKPAVESAEERFVRPGITAARQSETGLRHARDLLGFKF
jgi:hypothetical protein